MQQYCIWHSIPYAYIPDACGAVLKPFVVFISGSAKKGKCILCTTSEAACMTGYPCSSTATNNMHRCMHTHNMFLYGTIFIHYLLYGHVFNSKAASYIESMLHIHTYQCYICTHTHQQQFLAWYVYLPATTSVLPVMHFCENTLALLVLQTQKVLEGRGSGMGSV